MSVKVSRDRLVAFAAKMSPDEVADLIGAFEYSNRRSAFLKEKLTELLAEIQTTSDMEHLTPVKTSAHSALYDLKTKAVALNKEMESWVT